jgi:amidase
MPLLPPDLATLSRIASDHRLGVGPEDMQTYHAAAQGLLQSWDVVEGLYAQAAPTAPERAWTRPDAADNPLGAWYVKTDITETTTGPLAGRRVVIKDNISVAGVPMMNGSKTVEGFTPAADAAVVTRVLAAGATVVGKAVCEDLCFSGGSSTSKTGPVHNPWDTTRSTGGSSSGPAALVATGEADLAIGGDQGGSIRIPASWCGLVGHKPTHGLVPYTGAFPIEVTIDHLGPIARTVGDAALLLSVLAGPDGKDPRQPSTQPEVDYVAALEKPAAGLRIGVLTEGFHRPESEPEVDATVRAALDVLRDAGLAVEDVSIPWHLHGPAIWNVIAVEGAAWQMVNGNGHGMNWKGHYDPEQIDFYGAKWRADPGAFSETVKLVIMGGAYATDTTRGRYYAMARDLEPLLTAAYDAALANYDVLVMPTTPMRATELPAAGAPVAEVLTRCLGMAGNTCPFDVTGHPACAVPAGLADGLPVGMMIVARKFHDATVLRVARALEIAVGGFPRLDRARSDA